MVTKRLAHEYQKQDDSGNILCNQEQMKGKKVRELRINPVLLATWWLQVSCVVYGSSRIDWTSVVR